MIALYNPDVILFLLTCTGFLYFGMICISICLLIIWRLQGSPSIEEEDEQLLIEEQVTSQTSTSTLSKNNQTKRLLDTNLDLEDSFSGSDFSGGIIIKDDKEVFKLPLVFHVLVAICYISLTLITLITNFGSGYIGMILFLSGVPIYWIFIHLRKKNPEFLSSVVDRYHSALF